MKTVHEYLATRSDSTLRFDEYLQRADKIISDLGYTWQDIPFERWPLVYERLNLSNSLVSRVDGAIRAYYRWVEREGGMSARRMSYYHFEPILGKTIPIGATYRYVASLDDLLNLAAEKIHELVGVTPRSKSNQLSAFALLWLQLSTSELSSLKPEDVTFYESTEAFEKGAPFTPTCLPQIKVLTIRREGAQPASVVNRNVIDHLYRIWTEAIAEHPGALIVNNSGKPYTTQGIYQLVRRLLDKINEENDLMLTIASIQANGLYCKAYAYWKNFNLPWVYTKRTIDQFYQCLGKPKPTRVNLRENEFYQFLQYAKELQGENI